MGWALGMQVPERFASIAIGGAQPFEPLGPEMRGRYNAMMHYLELSMADYVQWREEHGVVWPEPFRARMLANDNRALAAFMQATLTHYPLGDLARMSMPVLVIGGDDDELMAGKNARRAAAALAAGHFVELENADHPALYLDGLRVLPVLSSFLEAVALPISTSLR